MQVVARIEQHPLQLIASIANSPDFDPTDESGLIFDGDVHTLEVVDERRLIPST